MIYILPPVSISKTQMKCERSIPCPAKIHCDCSGEYLCAFVCMCVYVCVFGALFTLTFTIISIMYGTHLDSTNSGGFVDLCVRRRKECGKQISTNLLAFYILRKNKLSCIHELSLPSKSNHRAVTLHPPHISGILAKLTGPDAENRILFIRQMYEIHPSPKNMWHTAAHN